MFTFLVLFLSLLICLSAIESDRNDRRCTSGFMNIDRMNALLGNVDIRVENDYQRIFPKVGFTCNGTVLSWVFGAKWEGNSQSFTELQVWRPAVGNYGVFTKVGSTEIFTSENRSELYYYPLSSPLAFQAGDVFGFYQPPSTQSQLSLLFESDERSLQVGYYYHQPQYSPTIFRRSIAYRFYRYQMLIDVIADPPDCQYGFQSVERMRSMLGIAGTQPIASRQQITPDMKFTCDGIITAWIIGANWNRKNILFPEFQVWRKIRPRKYKKISGRVSELQTSVSPRINAYSVLPPMPVKSGDILGIFIPNNSRLSLLSESTNSKPKNYYLPTEDSEESSLEIFDLEGNVGSEFYYPLISAVIVISSSSVTTSSVKQPFPVPTSKPNEEGVIATNQNEGEDVGLALGLGLSISAVALLVGIVVTSITLCVRQITKNTGMRTAANVAYEARDERLHETDDLPPPLPPRNKTVCPEYATNANSDGAKPSNNDKASAKHENVMYNVVHDKWSTDTSSYSGCATY